MSDDLAAELRQARRRQDLPRHPSHPPGSPESATDTGAGEATADGDGRVTSAGGCDGPPATRQAPDLLAALEEAVARLKADRRRRAEERGR